MHRFLTERYREVKFYLAAESYSKRDIFCWFAIFRSFHDWHYSVFGGLKNTSIISPTCKKRQFCNWQIDSIYTFRPYSLFIMLPHLYKCLYTGLYTSCISCSTSEFMWFRSWGNEIKNYNKIKLQFTLPAYSVGQSRRALQ